MRLLVTGATGFVGGWIVDGAVAAGYQVRVLVRDGAAAGQRLPAGVEILVGSLTDEALLDRALAGVDALVHAAAAYQYGHAVGTQQRSNNPEIARAVLAAAGRAATPHVIDVSSAIVFAPHPDGPLRGVTDVDSPMWTEADRRWGDPYLSSKVLAYRDTLAARKAGLPVSSIHPGMVMGPRDRGPGVSGEFLLGFIRERLFPATFMPWIDVRDLADVVLAVARLSPGGRYLVSRDWIPLQDVAASVDRVTGIPRRRVFIPPSLVLSLARLNDLTGGRANSRLAPRPSLEYLLGNRGHIDNSTGTVALGRPFRPVDETVHDSIAWWAANGLVRPGEAGAAAQSGAAKP